MEGAVQTLFNLGIAPSTNRVYKSVRNRYLQFCSKFSFPCLPLSEPVLCMFVAYLSLQGVKHQSVKCYLAALRHMQIELRGEDPFGPGRFPRLEYVLKGLKRNGPPAATERRLPITPDILVRLHGFWNNSKDDPNTAMLWAACCLGFFGFLRSGEFTVVSDRAFDPASSLTPTDVAVDSRDNPTVVSVYIKQSKNDPFRAGVHVYLGRTNRLLCPVAAILSYLAMRAPPANGPLFVFSDGRYLTRQRLVQHLRSALQHCGINPAHYSGHSFRIGAASTAARAGVEDSAIQLLGRWHSAAYQRYIRTPREQLAAVSARLTGASHSLTN